MNSHVLDFVLAFMLLLLCPKLLDAALSDALEMIEPIVFVL